MSIPKAKVFTCMYLCLTCSVSLSGQAAPLQNKAKTCRQFVEMFYKWYQTISTINDSLPAADRAVKNRPYLFSSELVWRLREESEVQDRAGSDLVSLDIDPFSGPDGSGNQFLVEKITTKDDLCWADIHVMREGGENTVPDVTTKLAFEHGQWVFVNFYYLSSDPQKAWNLLSALKAARKSWKADGLLVRSKN